MSEQIEVKLTLKFEEAEEEDLIFTDQISINGNAAKPLTRANINDLIGLLTVCEQRYKAKLDISTAKSEQRRLAGEKQHHAKMLGE